MKYDAPGAAIITWQMEISTQTPRLLNGKGLRLLSLVASPPPPSPPPATAVRHAATVGRSPLKSITHSCFVFIHASPALDLTLIIISVTLFNSIFYID